jgi:lipopolysaccharide/colanic/teichoic acid biosynthesis glycosyltransferase
MRVGADKMKDQLIQQNESKDGVIFKMKNDPRITRVGKYLRRFSIDEAPQILNVFLGDLSIVGPRPPLPREVALYSLEDRKRLHVKPGLTCFWQIQGRSDIPFKDQVRLDLQYISSQSIWMDLWIIIKTVPAVLLGKGAY